MNGVERAVLESAYVRKRAAETGCLIELTVKSGGYSLVVTDPSTGVTRIARDRKPGPPGSFQAVLDGVLAEVRR